MITKSKNEQIKMILDDIDLDTIQKTMSHLNWTWKDSNTGERRVPNTKEISIVAKDCMERAWNSEDKIANIGGFEAIVENGVIEVRFIIAKSNPLSNLLG